MGAPFKPIDLERLSEVIQSAPGEGPAAEVGRDWLERVKREIEAGRAARAQLAAAGVFDQICQDIQAGAQE
jgi:hypothetical protein